MKIKLIQSNNLPGLEKEVKKFLKEAKVENLQLVVNNNLYVMLITYYELI